MKEGNILITVPDKAMPNLSRIVYKKGGEVPELLAGLYTGWTMAKKAIDAYNALKPEHKPKVYNSDKNVLTKDEEAVALDKTKEKAKEANKKKEANEVKENK